MTLIEKNRGKIMKTKTELYVISNNMIGNFKECQDYEQRPDNLSKRIVLDNENGEFMTITKQNSTWVKELKNEIKQIVESLNQEERDIVKESLKLKENESQEAVQYIMNLLDNVPVVNHSKDVDSKESGM